MGVDLVQLGLTPESSCNVTELWEGGDLQPVYGRMEAALRPHVSLFVKLSGCHTADPPPRPPAPPSPPSPDAFCPEDNLAACEAALRLPTSVAGPCSADFEHVQHVSLPTATTTAAPASPAAPAAADTTASSTGAATASSATGSRLQDKAVATASGVVIEALYLDAQGNGHCDLHVVGVVYADAGGTGPGKLVASSTPVLVAANQARARAANGFGLKGSRQTEDNGLGFYTKASACSALDSVNHQAVPLRPYGSASYVRLRNPTRTGRHP